MSVTGERDDRPGGGPQKVGIPIVDLMTGMYAAVAVLAALAGRERTGKGDFIDIGMLDVQVAMLCNQAMNFLTSGKVPKRTGTAHPNIQPQDVFRCKDGEIVLACGNDAPVRQAVRSPGLARPAEGRALRDELRARAPPTDPVAAAARKHSRSRSATALVDALEAAGVPCGPINSVPEVFEEPQVKERNMLINVPHPLSGTVPLVNTPMRFAEHALDATRAPPLLGQHTVEVLRELGYDDAKIERWRKAGAT